jgi:hypothetical protein
MWFNKFSKKITFINPEGTLNATVLLSTGKRLNLSLNPFYPHYFFPKCCDFPNISGKLFLGMHIS